MRTLAFTELYRNNHIILPKQDELKIAESIAWRIVPYFPRRGRMAWYRLKTPVASLTAEGRLLSGVKLKGLGAYNPPVEGRGRDAILDSFAQDPVQPTTLPLSSFATYPHLGFDVKGELTVSLGATAPVGGIVVERATREYLTAQRLIERGSHRLSLISSSTIQN